MSAESKNQTKVEIEPKIKVKTKKETKLKTKAKTKTKTKGKTKTKAKEKNETKSKTKTESKKKTTKKTTKKVEKKTVDEKELLEKNIDLLKRNIQKDLEDQLVEQNKFGSQFTDMIQNYIYYVELKERLKYDIKVRGIRYECVGGNGFITTKPNESCERIIKVTTEMRKILCDLELKEPEAEKPTDGIEDDLL